MPDEKKLLLGIKDRLNFPVLFPERSSYIDQTIAEDLSKKIRISQEEMEKVKMKFVEGEGGTEPFYQWQKGEEVDKEVIFTDMEVAFLKKNIERLDKKEAITKELYPLFKAIKEL